MIRASSRKKDPLKSDNVPMYYDVTTGKAPDNFKNLIDNFRTNFLTRSVEILPGLTFNQYETVKRIYFYIHRQFLSGNYDEQGQVKHFYDLLTDRNKQVSKNIHLDTKDILIKAENQYNYLKSWVLRKEFTAFAKETSFGVKLNELADDLPNFGSVVWKKIKDDKGGEKIVNVSLLNLMNDPLIEKLSDGPTIERLIVNSKQIKDNKMFEEKEVEKLLKSGYSTTFSPFITQSVVSPSNAMNHVDNFTDYYELWEFWGIIPLAMYARYNKKQKDYSASFIEKNPTFPVYVTAVSSTNASDDCVLFMEESDKKLYPYDEVHFSRVKGRWLGLGNYELCFPEQAKANELAHRFFNATRMSLSHFFQKRGQTPTRNITGDLLDGDILSTDTEITPIPTELRGAAEYRLLMQEIENRVDRKVNSLEIVTGENSPSGTPWKLGQQQQINAKKLFDQIRENEGLFIERVVNNWLIPDFKKQITKKHILEIMGDQEDLEIYYSAITKTIQYGFIKEYILDHEDFPTIEQITVIAQLAKEKISKSVKKLFIKDGYFQQDDKYNLKVVTTGENENSEARVETLTTLFQTMASNPAALQDNRLMKILNIILEEKGFSPLQINAINTTEPNPSLNPANQGGANPAQQAGMPPEAAGALPPQQ